MKDLKVNGMARLLCRSARRLILVPVALAMAFVLISGPATSSAASSGLVAAYSFDEGSGSTVADASGNGNGGTIGTATWSASGKYGRALSFNGTSAKVTIPDVASLDLSTAMTLEAWVRPSAVTNKWRDVIYKGNDNYYLAATSQPGSRPDLGGTFGQAAVDLRGQAALAVNAWSYLAGTYDGSTLRRVNGTQVASQTRTGAITTSTNPLTIGGDPNLAVLCGSDRRGAGVQRRVVHSTDPDRHERAPDRSAVGRGVVGDGGERRARSISAGALRVTTSRSRGMQVFRCQGAGCSLSRWRADDDRLRNTGLSGEHEVTAIRCGAVDSVGLPGPVLSERVRECACAPRETQPPSVPGGSVGDGGASASEIDLSWVLASDNVVVTGYQVFRRQGAGCSNFVQAASSTTTGYSNTGALSIASSRMSADKLAIGCVGGERPGRGLTRWAPGGLGHRAPRARLRSRIRSRRPCRGGCRRRRRARARSISSWGAASDNVAVTGYQVFRCQGAGCSNLSRWRARRRPVTARRGLSASTSYSYQVRAVDAAGNQGPLGDRDREHAALPHTRAAVGAGWVVGDGGERERDRSPSWGAASDNVAVTGYQVFRCQGAGREQLCPGGELDAPTGYSNTGLSASTSYSYQVRAVDAAGNQGPFSATATASTPALPDTQPPSVPGGLSATAASASEIDLSWGAASDNVAVTGYQVFRCQGAGCSNFVQVASSTTTGYSNTGLVCEHELQLSGAGGRRGRQPGPVLGDRDREHACAPGYAAAVGAGWVVGDGGERERDRSQLGCCE